MPDKGEPIKLGLGVAPLPATSPLRFGHEPDLFAIADRLNLGFSLARQSADCQHVPSPKAKFHIGLARAEGKTMHLASRLALQKLGLEPLPAIATIAYRWPS
jgi:hypothetical protein